MAEASDVPRRLAGVLMAAAALSAGNGTAEAQLAGRIEIGQPFPPLVLPRLNDGSPASLAQFRGRKVMLHVFASW